MPRRRVGFRAVVAAIGLGLVAACAAPEPTAVNPTFVDPVSPRARAPKGRPVCGINVSEITDSRRSPEILGVMAGRAIKGPDDPAGWLRSIVGGLGTRGYAVAFADPAAPADAVSVKVTLQTAWVADIAGNKSANVVLHVVAGRPGAAGIDRSYRGNVSLINWAGTQSEMRDVVDRAFADALDDIANDLRPLCPA